MKIEPGSKDYKRKSDSDITRVIYDFIIQFLCFIWVRAIKCNINLKPLKQNFFECIMK